MDIRLLKAEVANLSSDLHVTKVEEDWIGCAQVWEILEKIASEGASVVVKIDGQRTTENDNGRYTVVVSGGALGDDFFRLDTHLLEEGLARAILHYAERVWKRPSKLK